MKGLSELVWLTSSYLKTMVLVFLVLMLGACAKRTVYVPREWQAVHTPPEASKQQSPKPQSAPSSRTSFLGQQAPIKESDISANTQAAAPQETEKPTGPPQYLASMHLVDQAKAALAQGKAESAISLFEQAVQVDVYNGEAFFGLAKAWKMRGSMVKASEFARKAEILFQDKPEKLKEVYLFEADIFKELGDSSKEGMYRQKASRF